MTDFDDVRVVDDRVAVTFGSGGVGGVNQSRVGQDVAQEPLGNPAQPIVGLDGVIFTTGDTFAGCFGHFTLFHRGAVVTRRQQHGVDDVDDAIRGFDVGDDNVGLVDHDAFAVNGDVNRRAQDGISRVERDHIGGHNATGHDVVKQYVGQSGGVGQQLIQRAFGQSGKGFISRGEDSERTFALEGINQTGSFQSRGQSGEAAISDGSIDDVQAFLHRRIFFRHLALFHRRAVVTRREQNGVDDVDDAVGGRHVSGCNGRIIDHHRIAINGNGDGHPGHRIGGVEIDHVGGRHFARNNVVKQHFGQSVRIGQQLIQRPFGQGVKGFIGRGKDGEGAFPLQRFDQTGGFESGG